MEFQATFEPSPGQVHVRFVRGVDGLAPSVERVRRAGLSARFAVVQDTYVEGCGEMYFDEPLWRALVEFLRSRSADGAIEVTTDTGVALPLDVFLQSWESADAEPPPLLTSFEEGQPTICMVTEYWTHAGGPKLYHDSYTYSIYSKFDLGAEVMATLNSSSARTRWTMAQDATTVSWRRPPSFMQRLKAWISGTPAYE